MSRRAKAIAAILAAVALAAIAALLLLPRSAAPDPSGTPTATAARTASTSAPDDAPLAVFIGDSYTVGTATPISGAGFPAMLGELRGWRVQNLAIAGTGYSTGRADGACASSGCQSYIGVLPRAVDADPDILVVSGGRNDLQRAHVEAAVTAFYAEVRRQLPDVRLIVTSPLWDDSPTPDALLALRERVAAAAENAGAEYLDLGDLFLDRPDLIASDDLHPNEEGLALIARRIDELLAR
ncbi:SGNH/GDSL hydrolase family protein [Agrococcus jenensis]|uniref:Lysophospholipase L1-like esterase n=1 Tax=Agrococcus jenensis TaxID=46353 RepID=A0A3N2ATE6_9MICO|nr:SGNH/GDSL hydrolase family protein [Agrococcus jenensis]ROR66256.1 lysophospholipase L1-like esterase [Agrococcus jenensis]